MRTNRCVGLKTAIVATAAAIIFAACARSQDADAVLARVEEHEATARQSVGMAKESTLAQATDELARFLAAHADAPRAPEIRYKLAELLKERADALETAQLQAADAKAKLQLAAKAAALCDKAIQETTQAAEGFRKLAGEARFPRGKTAEEQTPQERAWVKMVDAILLEPRVMYTQAKAYVGTEKHDQTLRAAAEKFEAFIKEYPGLGRTLQAKRGLGHCQFRLKEYDRALRAYRKVIRTRPIPQTEEIRQLAYFDRAQCFNACGRYQDAIKTVNVMLKMEWPSLLGQRKPVALAAKLEEAKAFAELAKQSRFQAAELRKQGQATDANAELQRAKRRIKNAIQAARQVASTGGAYGRQATDIIKECQGLLAAGGTPTAADVLAQAESRFKAGELAQAIKLYKQGIELAKPAQQQQVIQAWLKLGACYAKQNQYADAAKCFGYPARTFGPQAVPPNAAYISVYFYNLLYQKQNSSEATQQYLDALKFFVRSYPNHPKTKELEGNIQALEATLHK